MRKCANVFAMRSRFFEFSSLETSFVYGILSTRDKCMRAMLYRDLNREVDSEILLYASLARSR